VFKRILLGLLGLFVLAVVGLFVLAHRPELDPIAPSAKAFPADLVARGEVLAGAGYCASCHTAKGGAPYAGGYAMETGFGTIYSTNITPDPDTGIGRWSEEAFRRAMREGVARDGSHLFPAFPYQHFSLVTDEDIHALYAYFMTRTAVKAPARKPHLPFPLNVRALQAGWKLLYVHKDDYGPITGKTPEWNRGAYLAEGLGHCSACHSPRNSLGAEKGGAQRYTGAVIDNWYAPPLGPANKAPVPWNTDELYAYMHTGATPLHGVAAGPMSHVVHDGLVKLPDADVRAIAAYFADRFGTTGQRTTNTEATLARVMATSALGSHQQIDRGATLYTAACASCHYNSGPMPLQARPELGLNSALTASDPSTLIQVILHGVSVPEGLPDTMMPSFAHSFSDADIAALAAWLRSTRTDQPPWPELPSRVTALREASASETTGASP
jgi:mono/diheme cytochrome c family protein